MTAICLIDHHRRILPIRADNKMTRPHYQVCVGVCGVLFNAVKSGEDFGAQIQGLSLLPAVGLGGRGFGRMDNAAGDTARCKVLGALQHSD